LRNARRVLEQISDSDAVFRHAADLAGEWSRDVLVNNQPFAATIHPDCGMATIDFQSLACLQSK
jgi:hypothetical protein